MLPSDEDIVYVAEGTYSLHKAWQGWPLLPWQIQVFLSQCWHRLRLPPCPMVCLLFAQQSKLRYMDVIFESTCQVVGISGTVGPLAIDIPWPFGYVTSQRCQAGIWLADFSSSAFKLSNSALVSLVYSDSHGRKKALRCKPVWSLYVAQYSYLTPHLLCWQMSCSTANVSLWRMQRRFVQFNFPMFALLGTPSVGILFLLCLQQLKKTSFLSVSFCLSF